MGIKEGTYDFTLSKPLSYKPFKGKDTETNLIVLNEPSMEHIKFYLRLKQMLTRSQMELAKQAGQLQDTIGEVVKPLQDQVDKIESETDQAFEMFSVCLQASESVDIGQFIGTFENMALTPAKKAICRVDGQVNMTSALWDNLQPEDAFNMAVRWCAFFAMPSLEGVNKESEKQPESPTEPTAV
jgi:hypothetical protein